MLSLPEWVTLVGMITGAIVALVKASSDAAKTRAEIAQIRAGLTRNDHLIAETHHQVTPNNGGSLLDSSVRNEAALESLAAAVEKNEATLERLGGSLADTVTDLRTTAADLRGLRRDVGRLADADQQLIEADQRDREAADHAHTFIHQRIDRLETN